MLFFVLSHLHHLFLYHSYFSSLKHSLFFPPSPSLPPSPPLPFLSLSPSLLLPLPPSAGAIPVGNSFFSSSSGPIFLTELACQGTEKELSECFQPSPLGSHHCTSNEHAGVICPCKLTREHTQHTYMYIYISSIISTYMHCTCT